MKGKCATSLTLVALMHRNEICNTKILIKAILIDGNGSCQAPDFNTSLVLVLGSKQCVFNEFLFVAKVAIMHRKM